MEMNKVNILIVDDNISTLTTLSGSVDWKSIKVDEVYTAQSVEEALETFRKYSIDILLCDIEMPGTDGLTMVRRLRKEGNQVVCIFLTAHAEFEYARQAIEVNSIDYILKPYSLKDVTEKLRSAVQLCNERSQNSSYIKYGKLWVDSQETLSESSRQKLVSPESDAEHQGVHKAKEYMKDHYTEQITLNDIAAYTSYNPSYLSTIFKRHEGIPPLDYLTGIRIRQARILLACNDFSIGDVAMMVGFQNISYFNKIFKKNTGQTPREYKSSVRT